MDEKQRTKVLGGVLAAILGIMVAKPALMNPINAAKQSLIVADRSHESAAEKDWQVDLAKQSIDDARRVSLPPGVSDAQRLYLSWITNLAEQSRFSQIQVTPGRTENRPGKYVAVAVDVEAEASMETLSRFLFLFEQADLLHRIASLEIKCSNAQGAPQLSVKLSAEGMSVAGSPSKADVFARTYLPTAVNSDATEVVVGESADFPGKFPFKAQLGKEMVNVLSVDDKKWKIERGIEGTKAIDHPDNEYIELFPVAGIRKSVEFAQYEDFVKASLFTKPAPTKIYKPDLEVASKTIEPGKTLTMTVKVRDINLDIGKPRISMEGAVEGMTFDSESGEFEWTPPEDSEAAKYDLTFILTQANNEELKIEKTASISVQLANAVPTLDVPSEAVVILGRDFSMELKAEDDGGPEGLTFSLDGEPPAGLSVDGTSLTWNPPNTFVPGDYEFSVKVSDNGTPAKTATKSVTLKVQDDTAASTKFTSSVGLDAVPVAWFWNQVENKRPKLRLGQRLAIADIDAELTEIGKRHVLLSDAAGIWKLKLGDSLRQRELIEPAEPKVTEEPPATQDSPAAEEPPAAEELPAAETPPVATESPVTEEASDPDPAPQAEPPASGDN